MSKYGNFLKMQDIYNTTLEFKFVFVFIGALQNNSNFLKTSLPQ